MGTVRDPSTQRVESTAEEGHRIRLLVTEAVDPNGRAPVVHGCPPAELEFPFVVSERRQQAGKPTLHRRVAPSLRASQPDPEAERPRPIDVGAGAAGTALSAIRVVDRGDHINQVEDRV